MKSCPDTKLSKSGFFSGLYSRIDIAAFTDCLKAVPFETRLNQSFFGKLSEREQHLQIDPPAGGAGRKRRPGQRVRRSEIRRIQIADRRRVVHVVQQIARADAEGQVVLVTGFVAEGERAATAASQSAASKSTATAAATARATARDRRLMPPVLPPSAPDRLSCSAADSA